MSKHPHTFLDQALSQLRDEGLERHLVPVDALSGVSFKSREQSFINFASNDYLGLARDPVLSEASSEAARLWGTGSGASRLVSGSFAIHHELERQIARFKKESSALIFTSGYQANLGALQALVTSEDTVWLDRYCHASLVDAARLAGAKLRVYPHLDLDFLEKKLKASRGPGRQWIITDSYFSMDGDTADLKRLVELARRYDACTFVDDAHATGVFGSEGRGLNEANGVCGQITCLVGTFSKAMGSQGGFVCASETTIKWMVNKARTFIYTTAPSPAVSGASLAAIRRIETDPSLRQRLWKNVECLRKGLEGMGLDLMGSVGPIIPVKIGDTRKTLLLAEKLKAQRIWAPAIRPPTVPKGSDRIRLSVSAAHTTSELEHLLNVLRKH